MSVKKDLVFNGMAKLLSECSPHVTEDLRDLIEEALSDVCEINPNLKTWRREGRIFLEPAHIPPAKELSTRTERDLR
jgi:hypothetical protein